MSVDEIIDRERKGTFGFTDDRRCLFTYGDFRRLLMEIEEAWKREQDELMYSFDPTRAGSSKAPDPSAYAIEGMKGFEIEKGE